MLGTPSTFLRASRRALGPPPGSATAGCSDVEQWQWPGHAAGVNPHPSKRVTEHGDDVQKTVWAYTGAVTQGEAMQVQRSWMDPWRSA